MKAIPARNILFFLFILFSGSELYAQPASPHETAKAGYITVTYGRPYKKGREIFGKLVPFGKVYRCGADSATTIEFGKDVNFGGKPVKAGKYTLFVIPNEKQWTVILNGQLHQFGAFSYEKYKDKDVVHVDVPVTTLSTPFEQLTITPNNKELTIAWDTTKVSVPLSF
jgi:hypothetical protein